MKFALITGPSGFPLVSGLRLSYHLALAQYFDDDDYMKFYGKAILCGDHVMLDNGAAELGKSMDFNVVAQIAKVMHVDEVVMPDVLDDMDATLDSVKQYLHLIPERQRVMVPQGKTWEEWTMCLDELVMMGCRTIGVAKRYEAFEGGRARALRIIEEREYHLSYDVHLLGCFANPVKEISTASVWSWVRGIDTAAPLAHAQNNVTMDASQHYSYDWNKPVNETLALANVFRLLQLVRS